MPPRERGPTEPRASAGTHESLVVQSVAAAMASVAGLAGCGGAGGRPTVEGIPGEAEAEAEGSGFCVACGGSLRWV